MDELFSHSPDVLTAVPSPPDEQYLVIHYTERCNAECAHCIVESGPKRVGTIDPSVARRALSSSSAGRGPRLVVFSGGESFLHLREIVELCELARARGIATRVISNGYWARTAERAAEMLDDVARRGIDQLVISFDAFHLPYVSSERVVNVWRGAALAKAPPYLAFSTIVPTAAGLLDQQRTESGWDFPRGVLATLKEYEFPLDRCVPRKLVHAQLALLPDAERAEFKRRVLRERIMISWEPLALGGRAAHKAAHLNLVRPLSQTSPPCSIAGRQTTLRADGNLYPCCSAWTNHSAHAYGTLGEGASLDEMTASMNDDALVRFIRECGPGELIAFLREQGEALPARYSDICQMCDTLLSRYSHARLQEAVAAHQQAKPWVRLLADVRDGRFP